MATMNYRRSFLLQGACTAAGLAAARALAQPAEQPSRGALIRGSEHWTTKKADAGDVRLFMWRKRMADAPKGTILFVHGSSVSATPVFDRHVPGKPQPWTMDVLSR